MPVSINMAGCAAFDAGNTGVALALFQKAVQAAPQDHSMQGNLARNEFVLGRVESAQRRAAYLASVSPMGQSICDEFAGNLARAQRPAALAGTFYAADAAQLRRDVDALLGPPAPPPPQGAQHQAMETVGGAQAFRGHYLADLAIGVKRPANGDD